MSPLRDIIANTILLSLRRRKLMVRYFLFSGVMLLLIASCDDSSKTFFTLMDPEKTGILFNNYIEETDSFNILFDEYIYNGGGVGVGDFNNDGLQDLYFTGNIVANRLFLNRGNFNFEDVTEKSGVGARDIWSAGVSVVDINNDGLMDMYVSATFKHQDGNRKNKLFINQGLKMGIPTFIDEAAKFGIDDDHHTTQGVFFDYDLDGDLDLYNLTNVFLGKRLMSNENADIKDRTQTIDILYRNEGNGKFTDVSNEAGIIYEGFGLGIAVLDVNKDNYPDLYISNDFVSSDLFYINNGDGTFSNQIDTYFKHVSYASMGNDASDINNDGLVDIMTLEMLPSDIINMKMMYGNTVFNRDELIQRAGYFKQYLRNCLQHNNGNGSFSDISYLLGISATDWSWSTLFADFDNDGFKDLAVANGFPRNVTDKDYVDHLMAMIGFNSNSDLILPYIPEYKSNNFFFVGHEGKRFEDVSDQWGIQIPSYSNGAAFADLDNDGDLDYVTNNINQPAFIFKNNLNTIHPERKWLIIHLAGNTGNMNGLGAKISVYTQGKMQYYEHNPYRGYISSVDPGIHFGLDTCSIIDSLHICWPSGEEEVRYYFPANREIILDIKNAEKPEKKDKKIIIPIFKEISDSLNLKYKHHELDFMDYKIQLLLPHMHSREGPGLAVGDLNGDQLEDFVVGNGRGAPVNLFYQRPEGGFDKILLQDTADVEVTGLLLFDCDNDEDLDLYAVSGGSEFYAHSYHFRDRLFKNDGKGHFQYDPQAIPEIFISGSIVTAADYDRDADLDLFIGGRVVPQSYPFPERSVLLRNEGGIFKDVTELSASEFMSLGMVTSALWTDYDLDGWVDLLVAGEWMPVRMFRNNQGRFEEVSEELGLLNSEGWWNSIQSGDYDQDGDLDYALGNQGLNNRYSTSLKNPIYVIAKDFDNNGIVDPIINAWFKGAYYPVHLRNDLIGQIQFLKTRFPRYIDYSLVNSENLFSKKELEGMLELKTRLFESVLLIQGENGKYNIKKLPFEAQYAPVKGMLSGDFNSDKHPDLLMTGNNFNSEAINGSHDAFIGLFLKGNQSEMLTPERASHSGFFVDGDGRSLVSLFDNQTNQLIIASQNADSLKIFRIRNPGDHWIKISPTKLDRCIKIDYRDGSEYVKELYYGSSYLSQTSRDFLIDKNAVKKIIFINYAGELREISF